MLHAYFVLFAKEFELLLILYMQHPEQVKFSKSLIENLVAGCGS